MTTPHSSLSLPTESTPYTRQLAILLSCIPSDKSAGSDSLPQFLTHTAFSIATPLSLIFNSSLPTGVLPADWKHSLVVPIPMASPPLSSSTDYCPISLFPLISKVFECHLFEYLLKHVTTQNFLSDRQSDFLPGFFTETALVFTIQSWLYSLDNNKSTCAVFLDIKKAFDSVPHKLLLNLVISQYSFFSSVLALFLPHSSHTKSYYLWL